MCANRWKNRSTYGSILYRKATKLKKRFELEEEKETPDLDILEQLSRMLDSTILVQMKNLAKSEELDQLAKEELRVRNEPVKREIQTTEELEDRLF